MITVTAKYYSDDSARYWYILSYAFHWTKDAHTGSVKQALNYKIVYSDISVVQGDFVLT